MTIFRDLGPTGTPSSASVTWSPSLYLTDRSSSRFRVQVSQGSPAWNHVYGFGRVGTSTARGPQLYGNQCWSAGASVEASWTGFSADTTTTVTVSLTGGETISSFTIYPKTLAVQPQLVSGQLVLQVPPDSRMLIEVNGNRKDTLCVFVDTVAAETTPYTLGDTILVDSGNIGTLSTLGNNQRDASEPLVVIFPPGVWQLPTTAGSSTAPARTPAITREKDGQLWLVRPFTKIVLQRGAWVIGSLDMRQGNDIEVTGPGVLSGEWATWSDMLQKLQGNQNAHQAPGQFLTFNQQVAWSMFCGTTWDDGDEDFPSLACLFPTIVGSPFYLQSSAFNSYDRVKVISHWLFNCDGFNPVLDPATQQRTVNNSFAMTGDDALYFGGYNWGTTTVQDTHLIAYAAAPILVAYDSYIPSSTPGLRQMTNCTAQSNAPLAEWGFDLHTGVPHNWSPSEATWLSVHTYAAPAAFTASIIKLWLDGSDSDPLGWGMFDVRIDNLRVEGTIPFALWSIENCLYPFGSTTATNDQPLQDDKAGSAAGIQLKNISTETVPRYRSRLLGRDRSNTPHDITVENVTLGGHRLTTANWNQYVLQNGPPYNVFVDGHAVDDLVPAADGLGRRLRADARKITTTRHHGELVTYLSSVPGAPGRNLRAIVQRNRLQALGAEREIGAAVLEALVWLPFDVDPARGVVAVAIGDELVCVLQEGATAIRCRIVETVSEDAGGFLVRVQR